MNFFCSNPGHPFAAGLVLSKLSAVNVDDHGKETFATGGDLDRVKKVYILLTSQHFGSVINLYTK